ncbi:hypothetical protein L7F22_052985 [Adiantum nelumboides]|nr:hypothetical protein [Adiantum nelumboides]
MNKSYVGVCLLNFSNFTPKKGQDLASIGMPLSVARIACTNPSISSAEIGKDLTKNYTGKEDDELFKKENGRLLEIRTGVETEPASVHQQDETHSRCEYPGMKEYSACNDLRSLAADTQNEGWDKWWIFNRSHITTGKQLDGDQQSDISVELGTVDLGKEDCNGISYESLSSNQKLCCLNKKTEAKFPLKALGKGHQTFTSGIKEQESCLLAEATNKAQDAMLGEAELEM